MRINFQNVVMRCFVVVLILMTTGVALFAQNEKQKTKAHYVRLVKDEAARRIDVLIDGKLFTSYIWQDSLMKPVLYPVRTALGVEVTRGFPLNPKPGERADHPHQIGMWFNFGDVNGVDFWNNSPVRTSQEKARMGTILHQKIVKLKNGKNKGELTVECSWITPDGKQILREETRFIFYSTGDNQRMIDRITRLTAFDKEVLFRDNKEGLMAIRLARPLEQVTNVADIYIGADGKQMSKAMINNDGVTGRYFNDEGKRGDDVFGTRGKWAAIAGNVDGEDVTIAILDNPKNPNYPASWFARGYGLFAANPFGQRAYSKERKESPLKDETSYKLPAHKSVTLRYRVLIISGIRAEAEIEKQQRAFSKEIN